VIPICTTKPIVATIAIRGSKRAIGISAALQAE
jgi:hypothetical protein